VVWVVCLVASWVERWVNLAVALRMVAAGMGLPSKWYTSKLRRRSLVVWGWVVVSLWEVGYPLSRMQSQSNLGFLAAGAGLLGGVLLADAMDDAYDDGFQAGGKFLKRCPICMR